MRRYGKKTRIDDTTIAFGYLVDGCFHIVINTAFGNATQRSKCTGMRVVLHLLGLRRVDRKIEGATGTQLGMRRLDFALNAPNHQPFIAPIKLKGSAELKLQRHKR